VSVTDCNSKKTSLLNTVVKVGENVTMHCSTIDISHTAIWLVYNPVRKILPILTFNLSNPSLQDMKTL
jgi:hypothetical protein